MKKPLLIAALAISGSSAWGQLQINSPLYISPGSIIAVANGNVAASTPITGPGYLVMNGTTTQELNLSGQSADNVAIDNPLGVILTGDAIINDQLNFMEGSLSIGANDLMFTTTGIAINVTGADNKYVITDGAGRVGKMGLPLNTSFTFPVGRATTDYTPASITNLDPASRTFYVQVKNYAETLPVETNITEGIDRTWQITSDVSGPTNVALTHNDATNAAGVPTSGSAFNSAAAHITQQIAPGVWSNSPLNTDGGSPVNTLSMNFLVPSTPDETSYFTKSSSLSAPLPLDLLDFTAVKSGKNLVKISWTTAFEKSLSYFEVERSINGSTFSKISTVPAKNKNAETFYTIDDSNPLQGISYYRLHIVDVDGSHKNSQVKMVDFSDAPKYTLTPNPAIDHVKLTGTFINAIVEIWSSTGKRLYSQPLIGNAAQLDIAALTTGTYFVRISEEGAVVFNQKLVKL